MGLFLEMGALFLSSGSHLLLPNRWEMVISVHVLLQNVVRGH